MCSLVNVTIVVISFIITCFYLFNSMAGKNRHSEQTSFDLPSNPSLTSTNAMPVSSGYASSQAGFKTPVKRNREQAGFGSPGTPSKKTYSEADPKNFEGYIRSVGPVLSSLRCKYFRFTVENKPEHIREGLAYDLSRRDLMLRMTKRRDPVLFENVGYCFNKFNLGEQTVTVRQHTDIATAHVPLWPFDELLIPIVTIADITNGQFGHGLHVNIKARVEASLSETFKFAFQDNQLDCKQFVVADPSGGIKIHIWQELITDVVIGNSYQFTEVAVKTQNDKVYLSTSPRCTINEIDIVENIAEIELSKFKEKDENVLENRFEIISAECIKSRNCVRCKRKLVYDVTSLVRCVHCNMKQKWAKASLTFHANLSLEYTENDEVKQGKYSMFKDVLINLLGHEITNADEDDVETTLLELDPLEMRIDIGTGKVLTVTTAPSALNGNDTTSSVTTVMPECNGKHIPSATVSQNPDELLSEFDSQDDDMLAAIDIGESVNAHPIITGEEYFSAREEYINGQSLAEKKGGYYDAENDNLVVGAPTPIPDELLHK